MFTDGGEFYAVDRIEGHFAVLVSDEGAQVQVRVEDLPAEAGEGTVLRVSLDPNGMPDWSIARIDSEEADRRTDESRRILRELQGRDPGGDVTM